MNAAWGGLGRLWLALVLCLLTGVGPAAHYALADDCAELILDGGFEVGGVWDLGATLLTPTYVTYMKHGGNQSLALGITQGGNANSYSSARQFVVIPANVDRATLSFWFYAIVEGQPNADKMQLVLLNPDGSIEYVLWTSRADSRAWNQLTFDVSPWRGRALQVYFNVYNDGVGGTVGMFLDDVSLAACPGVTTQIPVTPSKTPSTAQPSKTPAPTRTPCGMVPPCATLPPPPPYWATPWESVPPSEPPPSYWPTPVWVPDPSASFLEESVLTGEVPTAIYLTPVDTADVARMSTASLSSSTPTVARRATEDVARMPTVPLSSSTPTVVRRATGTPRLSGTGESGFTPEVTSVSLALTAVPTRPAVRTSPSTMRPPNATPAPSEGRFVRWPSGWWWGVVAVIAIILGAWLWTMVHR